MSSLQEAFLSAIKNPSVIRFKDSRLDKLVPRHFYVAIPISKEASLVLCIITSKVDKRFEHSRKMKTVEGLVKVSKQDISCLSMDSVVDCNQASLVPNKSGLRTWMNPGTLEMHGELTHDMRVKVFAAIRKSPVVAEAIKKLLP